MVHVVANAALLVLIYNCLIIVGPFIKILIYGRKTSRNDRNDVAYVVIKKNTADFMNHSESE